MKSCQKPDLGSRSGYIAVNDDSYKVSVDENGISTDWLDKGIFSNYYTLAGKKLKEMASQILEMDFFSEVLFYRPPPYLPSIYKNTCLYFLHL